MFYMRILLTGGAGFVGTNVVNELLKENHQLTIIDNLKTGYHKNIPEGVRFVHMDCSDEKLLTEITEPFDALIHIGGEDPAECAARETLEETGIQLSGCPATYLGMTNDVFHADNKHYITLWYSFTINIKIEPQLLEPEKCYEWRWVPVNKIPEPVFLSLQKFIAGEIL